MHTAREMFRRGAIKSLPFLIVMIPFAMLFGVVATEAGMDVAQVIGFSVLVLAGAGTGKTKTLTAGVALRIAERGIPAQRILAVTFTNKAAGEMRERIVALLGGQAAPSWIGTFHGLCHRMLRAHCKLLNLPAILEVVALGAMDLAVLLAGAVLLVGGYHSLAGVTRFV